MFVPSAPRRAQFSSNSITIDMKLKALRYGEFFQGKISMYNQPRPVFIHFFECIEQETQEWLVDFYPKNGLTPGTVLAIGHAEQSLFCEVLGRKRDGRFVRLLNPEVKLTAVWAARQAALAH